MSEQLPAPEFDRQNYVRPNQNWTCGHAAEGRPCPAGPDRKGRCQATTECKPVLEIKAVETKGRWRCTRAGEACETGPLPDGACCRPIPRCSPVPNLRWLRGRFTLAVIIATVAGLLILLGRPPWRNQFINPGSLSQPHSGAVFAALAATNHLEASCGACHQGGAAGPQGLLQAALKADPGPFELGKQFRTQAGRVTTMDGQCEMCHTSHAFHQPMVATVSCTYCHQEHQGDKIAAVGDDRCNFCHGDAQVMAAASEAGAHLSAAAFHQVADRHQLVFVASRPAQGFTGVIHHFASDHPEFRFITDHWRDPDTLKFNHALHLTGATMPSLPDGCKLDCAFCHQPDASGSFMAPVKFEQNCRVCHSLQFDPETPGLQLPHGRVDVVQAFLHSLPAAYADFAARNGITQTATQTQFVEAKLQRLRIDFGSGEALSERVFLSSATTGPAVRIGTLTGSTRAVFPGCALCHEVKSSAANQFVVTPPVIVERWLSHAEFNHAKHAGLACEICHDAIHSQNTATMLLPARETCLECHSPRGGVADSCATCHLYHKLVAANVN